MGILITITVIAIFFSVFLAVKNIKLKANNTKLKKENVNLQYELGVTLVKEKENLVTKDNVISQERINSIKERFKETEKIKKGKGATKEDVEAFYRSQLNSVDRDNKLKK